MQVTNPLDLTRYDLPVDQALQFTAASQPGILRDLRRQQYDQIWAMNATLLLKGRLSPKHLRSAITSTTPEEASDAKRLGTISHAAVFEPDVDLDAELMPSLLEPGTTEWVIQPGDIKVRRGKKWEEFAEAHAGQTILTEKKIDEAREQNKVAYKIRDAIHAHPRAVQLLEWCSEYELTGLCVDCGVPCKFRIDGGPEILLDLKTTRSIDNHAFGKQCANLGYGFRLACYRRWLAKIFGEPVEEIWMIAVENVEPFDVAPRKVPDEFLDQNEPLLLKQLQGYQHAKQHDQWPGVCPDWEPLVIPLWAMSDDEVLCD